jgi:polar amino acid transport system permease protein
MANVFDIKLIFTNIPKLLQYLPTTLEVAFAAYIFSLILGLLVALVRIKKPKLVYQLVCFYVSFTRGTPVLVQLYATYFGIPMLLNLINYKFGTNLSSSFIPNVVFALLALSLNDAAYSSEYIRAAIENVERGQVEAAHSIGMTPFQTLKRIIIPEALVVALPSLGNSLISLIKGTSLVFTCAVMDITAGGKLIAGRNYRYFEMYISLAIIYWIITFIVSKIFGLFENLMRCDEGEVKKRNDRN